MVTTTVNFEDAQTQLVHLLGLALTGYEVVIAKDDVPVARLVPIQRIKKRRIAGLHNNAMQAHEDFNQPLPDAIFSQYQITVIN